MILSNFCVFEGIDGTGTTTQIKELERRCRERSLPSWFTCEPTEGEIGKIIRKALSGKLCFTPDTMARLFAADRGEHIQGENGIEEHLRSGELVVSDRYLFSSLAYQGSSGDAALPATLNESFPLPELLFFFDLDHDAAMDRVERRSTPSGNLEPRELEIYERRDFQRQVRERYREILPQFADREPKMRIVNVDAGQPIERIAEIIWSEIEKLPIFKG